MNELQQKVLRTHHGDILKNLVLDHDILGYLQQKDILTDTMVHSVQAKTAQHEKINELLTILPKRGPKAFSVFLEAVKKSSQFLADKLGQEYEKEQKQMEKEAKDKEAADQAQEEEQPPVPNTPRSQEKAFEKTYRPKDITERRHSLSVSTGTHTLTSNIIQQNLNNLHTKMKSRLHPQPSSPNNDQNQTFPSTEAVTFKMIDKLVDELFVHLDEHETTFSQCHALLGGRDRNFPIVSHIINLQKSKRQLEQDLKEKDQQKNKYADHISKLENRCRNQTTEINHLNEEIKKMKEEIEKLQVINSEREEKQKIIDELRKMVMDADTTKKSKLRSSYLALHYDSNSSEIKQLRAEVRSLKIDNENLKTENLMLKKSENLKKLAKLREDQTALKSEISNGPHVTSEEAKEGNPKSKQLPNTGVASHNMQLQPRSAFGRRLNIDRGVFVTSAEKPIMKGSLDNLQQVTDSAADDKAKLVAKIKEREKSHQELDFKFNSQNGSLGQKRTASRDRSNKRVTFHTDAGDQSESKDNIVRIPTADSDNQENSSGTKASANGSSEQSSNGKGSSASKPERSRGRYKQSLLKSKGSTKRSASLNSVTTSRDIMKMSSHLIQKSRNLRHPISN